MNSQKTTVMALAFAVLCQQTHMAEPDFICYFPAICREVSARGRHGGLGFTPASSILISKCDACNCAAYGGVGFIPANPCC